MLPTLTSVVPILVAFALGVFAGAYAAARTVRTDALPPGPEDAITITAPDLVPRHQLTDALRARAEAEAQRDAIRGTLTLAQDEARRAWRELRALQGRTEAAHAVAELEQARLLTMGVADVD